MDENSYKLLLAIHKEMGIISSDVAKIEVDVKEHMRRTAIAEGNIEVLHRAYYRLQGAFALVSFIATVTAIYHYLR